MNPHPDIDQHQTQRDQHHAQHRGGGGRPEFIYRACPIAGNALGTVSPLLDPSKTRDYHPLHHPVAGAYGGMVRIRYERAAVSNQG